MQEMFIKLYAFCIATMDVFQISSFSLTLVSTFHKSFLTLKNKYLCICVIKSHPYATKTYSIK